VTYFIILIAHNINKIHSKSNSKVVSVLSQVRCHEDLSCTYQAIKKCGRVEV